MCGRFNLRTTSPDIAEILQASWQQEVTHSPRFNIAPTQKILAVRRCQNGERELTEVRWGLIPSWSADTKMAGRLINARAETVMTKPSFRSAFKHRRCLIPANGFYEWRRDGNLKQPFHIHRPDNGLICFAGLWECWEKGEQPIQSATIITTAANALMRPIHDRMPAILPPDLFSVWLDPEIDPEMAHSFLQPYPGEDLQADTVSDIVNNARNEVPECIRMIS